MQDSPFLPGVPCFLLMLELGQFSNPKSTTELLEYCVLPFSSVVVAQETLLMLTAAIRQYIVPFINKICNGADI